MDARNQRSTTGDGWQEPEKYHWGWVAGRFMFLPLLGDKFQNEGPRIYMCLLLLTDSQCVYIPISLNLSGSVDMGLSFVSLLSLPPTSYLASNVHNTFS